MESLERIRQETPRTTNPRTMKKLQFRFDRRGIALVIVLVFVALLSATIVAFFVRGTTEQKSATGFSNQISTAQLSESAVALVMGQIRAATTEPNASWGSQPGMIRTYRNKGNGVEPNAFFKLYSSPQMILREQDFSADYDTTIDNPKTGWRERTGHYANLNEPVTSHLTGKKRYPIVDPEAEGKIPGFDLLETTTEGSVGDRDITAVKSTGSTDTSGGDPAENAARMVVPWLYMLKDGSVIAPDLKDTSDAKTVRFTLSEIKPTYENPIVGRMAFWTDDESCKVNINTAGGFAEKEDELIPNSYWDQPRFVSKFDRGAIDSLTGVVSQYSLALSQPVANEFQRYPGHPSTTSLGLLLGPSFGATSTLNSEQVYQITPRLIFGGSIGGTNRFIAQNDAPLKIGSGRLYSSVDELFYGVGSGQTPRIPNNEVIKYAGGEGLNPENIDQFRFFLTAHSKAPELNLFGRPRITMWPLHISPDLRNPTDNLIAFCSRIGPANKNVSLEKSYAFQRRDAYSPDLDANIGRNKELLNYLFNLTASPIPGYGDRTFAMKYPSGGRDGDRNYIIAQIFDYIRTANLRDTSRTRDIVGNTDTARKMREGFMYAPRGLVIPSKITSLDGTTARGLGRFPCISEVSMVFHHAGYTDGANKPIIDPVADRAKIENVLIRAFLLIETFNPMQGYTTITGFPSWDQLDTRVIFHKVEGLNGFALAGKNLNMPASGINRVVSAPDGHWHGRSHGGPEGFAQSLVGKHNQGSAQALVKYYPFQSTAPISIPYDATKHMTETLGFSGGKIKVSMNGGKHPGHTFELNFPATSIPIPTDHLWSDAGGFYYRPTPPPTATIEHRGSERFGSLPAALDAVSTLDGRIRWVYHERTSFASTAGDGAGSNLVGNPTSSWDKWDFRERWRNILQPGDVVRSMTFAGKADARTAMLAPNDTAFSHHDFYHEPAERCAHNLRAGNGSAYYNTGYAGRVGVSPSGLPDITPGTTQYGTLLRWTSTSNPPASTFPDIPPKWRTTGVKRYDGGMPDFDTGSGDLADGAFGNKPDEGNQAYRYEETVNSAKRWVYVTPYYGWRFEEVYDTFFTPNRQMTSAVGFGSLLAGPKQDWKTLLFNPAPADLDRHQGSEAPHDHLLLDLFHMPIVEPYAISEPFATAGKINMNYGMVPFTHIHRSTGMRAALHGTRITAVPPAEFLNYKDGAKYNNNKNFRYLVNRTETLKAFEYKFNQGFAYGKPNFTDDFFKSASEICKQYLYPEGGSNPKFSPPFDQPIKNFWGQFGQLSGDNLRERPYSSLYPRLTTKSNTYTVHMRVQALKKAPTSAASRATGSYEWVEDRDQVVGEYRGATTIERYVDPQDPIFDAGKATPENPYVNADTQSVEGAYRFRVVSSKRFTP